MGHHGYDCRSVPTEIRDKHMASHKKDIDVKRAPKVGTQHAAVEEDEAYVASIALEDNRMPTREKIGRVMGYQEMNIALSKAESDGKYKGILNGIGMSNQFSMGPDKSNPHVSSYVIESGT